MIPKYYIIASLCFAIGAAIFVYLFLLIKSEIPNLKMYIYGIAAILCVCASIYVARLKE